MTVRPRGDRVVAVSVGLSKVLLHDDPLIVTVEVNFVSEDGSALFASAAVRVANTFIVCPPAVVVEEEVNGDCMPKRGSGKTVPEEERPLEEAALDIASINEKDLCVPSGAVTTRESLPSSSWVTLYVCVRPSAEVRVIVCVKPLVVRDSVIDRPSGAVSFVTSPLSSYAKV